MYYGPPNNSHVLNYKMALQKYSDSLNRDKWTQEEDINLVKGIKQQFQDMLLQKTYQNEDFLRERSADIVRYPILYFHDILYLLNSCQKLYCSHVLCSCVLHIVYSL